MPSNKTDVIIISKIIFVLVRMRIEQNILIRIDCSMSVNASGDSFFKNLYRILRIIFLT